MDRDKRELRREKREVKRAGSQRRRRQLKRDLAENPEEAHRSEFDFGRLRSAGLNGIDRRPDAIAAEGRPQRGGAASEAGGAGARGAGGG